MSTNAITYVPARPIIPRGALNFSCLLSLPAMFWAATYLHFEVVAGCAMLLIAALTFRAAAHTRFASVTTLAGLFFALAILHAALGYVMAAPTSGLIWIGTASARVYATAFLVVSTGIAASCIGYAAAIPRPMNRLRRAAQRYTAIDSRLIAAARVVAIAGTSLMFTVYAKVGFLQMIGSSFAGARYLSAAGEEFAAYEWFAARALDLLTFSVPIVLAAASRRHRVGDWIIGSVGVVALLLPLRRANLMTVVFVLLIAGAATRRQAWKRAAVGALIGVVYLLSQVLFVSFTALDRLSTDQVFAIAGGALPEVRDLGWTIELIGDQRLHGSTFAQALSPVPSIGSEASQKYSLRSVTSHLIGLDMDRRTGGLRLTLPGEAYLNFDVFGPALVGVLFGMICAVVEVAVLELRKRRALWADLSAAFVYVWACFWIYLSGTQAAATVKMGAILLVATLWYARDRRPQGEAS